MIIFIWSKNCAPFLQEMLVNTGCNEVEFNFLFISSKQIIWFFNIWYKLALYLLENGKYTYLLKNWSRPYPSDNAKRQREDIFLTHPTTMIRSSVVVNEYLSVKNVDMSFQHNEKGVNFEPTHPLKSSIWFLCSVLIWLWTATLGEAKLCSSA